MSDDYREFCHKLYLATWEEEFQKKCETIKQEIEEFKPDIIHGQHIWILSSIEMFVCPPKLDQSKRTFV